MDMTIYPKRYRKSIAMLTNRIGMNAETAYRMMLMTAMLMDLHPEDDEVVQLIFEDCGVEVE